MSSTMVFLANVVAFVFLSESVWLWWRCSCASSRRVLLVLGAQSACISSHYTSALRTSLLGTTCDVELLLPPYSTASSPHLCQFSSCPPGCVHELMQSLCPANFVVRLLPGSCTCDTAVLAPWRVPELHGVFVNHSELHHKCCLCLHPLVRCVTVSAVIFNSNFVPDGDPLTFTTAPASHLGLLSISGMSMLFPVPRRPAHNDLVRSRCHTHEEPVLLPHVKFVPLDVLRHGLEQYLLRELGYFPVCGRPARLFHRGLAILIRRESVDDGCLVVHHERYHWRVRLYRLLDVGPQGVLQHSCQPNYTLHCTFRHAFAAEWYFGLFFVSGRRDASSLCTGLPSAFPEDLGLLPSSFTHGQTPCPSLRPPSLGPVTRGLPLLHL